MICHMPTVFSTIFKHVTIGAVLALLVAATASLSGCTPDNKSESLGVVPTASFTVTPLTGKVNTWVATSTTNGAFQWEWDAGLGNGAALGSSTDTVFYDSAGVYRLTLTAFGHGGFDTVSQLIQVDSNAPLINVLVNPSLTTDSGWTILNPGGTVTTIAFTPQGLNLSNTSAGSNGGVYQAVQVTAGTIYTFSANVQGSGASNSWIEFYFGTTEPVQGSDYTDNKLWSLNTYSGCGIQPFNGNVVALNCAGSGTSTGQITFPTSGTIYFLIKAGSISPGTLGTGGVTVSNVELGVAP
jgi:hypothetical protein